MRIEILGKGCVNCGRLYENALVAVKELGVEADVVKVEDMQRVMELGIMTSPAIAIDGSVKAAGRIPEPGEIKEWISA